MWPRTVTDTGGSGSGLCFCSACGCSIRHYRSILGQKATGRPDRLEFAGQQASDGCGGEDSDVQVPCDVCLSRLAACLRRPFEHVHYRTISHRTTHQLPNVTAGYCHYAGQAAAKGGDASCRRWLLGSSTLALTVVLQVGRRDRYMFIYCTIIYVLQSKIH